MKTIITRLVLGAITGALTGYLILAGYDYYKASQDYQIPACFVNKKEQLIIFLTKKTEKTYQGKLCNSMLCVDFLDSKEEIKNLIKGERFEQVNCETGEAL